MKRIFALWRMVAGQDLRLLWFAIRHEQRPGWLLPGLAGLTLLAVEPRRISPCPCSAQSMSSCSCLWFCMA